MKKTASKDGTRIAFKQTGAGKPILLVHGTTADHTRWDRITPRLVEHFAVFAMDRRGRGESGDGHEYDVMREAEDVAAVVDAINEPTMVLGHSYGALCSLEAARITNKISKLILYEPPIPAGQPTFSRELVNEIQSLVDQGKNEAALEVMMRKAVKMPDREFALYRQLPVWKTRITISPTIPREMNTNWTYQFDTEAFTHVHVPTMFLVGGNSPELFRDAVKNAAEVLPNSIIVTLPGEQHIAMDTNPDLFMKEVLNFLLEQK